MTHFMRVLFVAFLFVAMPVLAGSDNDPFKPRYQGNVTVSATGITGATALKYPGVTQVRVYNAGTVVIFVEFGISTIEAAVATGYALAPGAIEVLSIDATATHIAAITAGTAATLYVHSGKGI